MNHQVIFRSSIRRMRHVHVAIKQKDLCRSFSSTSRGTPNNDNNSSYAKNGIHATPFVSVAAGTATSKLGNGSSFSAGIGGDNISIGSRSTTISKKASNITSNATNSSFVGKSSFSNSAGSSNSNDDGGSSGPEFRNVYVHPLSQIVLEYLQDYHHEWVVAMGLDRSLTLHRDGSFELKHVHVPLSHASISMSMSMSTSQLSSTTHYKKDQPKSNFEPLISTSTSATAVMKQEKSNNETDTSDSDVTAKGPSKSQHHQQTSAGSTTTDNNDNIRIWTSYDEQEKKHWLTVRRGLFRQRFLLQDNLLTAWQGNRGVSLPERLHVAVDEMIRAVDRVDRQQQQQQAHAIGQQQWQQKGQRRFRKR
jgi:hypothetical protein